MAHTSAWEMMVMCSERGNLSTNEESSRATCSNVFDCWACAALCSVWSAVHCVSRHIVWHCSHHFHCLCFCLLSARCHFLFDWTLTPSTLFVIRLSSCHSTISVHSISEGYIKFNSIRFSAFWAPENEGLCTAVCMEVYFVSPSISLSLCYFFSVDSSYCFSFLVLLW